MTHAPSLDTIQQKFYVLYNVSGKKKDRSWNQYCQVISYADPFTMNELFPIYLTIK